MLAHCKPALLASIANRPVITARCVRDVGLPPSRPFWHFNSKETNPWSG